MYQLILRSAEKTFNFKENCLFCGHTDTSDSKHQKGHNTVVTDAILSQSRGLFIISILSFFAAVSMTAF